MKLSSRRVKVKREVIDPEIRFLHSHSRPNTTWFVDFHRIGTASWFSDRGREVQRAMDAFSQALELAVPTRRRGRHLAEPSPPWSDGCPITEISPSRAR